MERFSGMSPIHFDTIIVGQGLAGTAVAWNLRWRGQSVVVVDRDDSVTSSKVAAGLITPVTGQRLVPSWKFAAFRSFAGQFYRMVERDTGEFFFRDLPAVRLFDNETEISTYGQRKETTEFSDLVRDLNPIVDSSRLRSELGGFEMPEAGQLDVRRYLSVSRETFQREGQLRTANLALAEDIKVDPTCIQIPSLQLEADRIVFCEGIAAGENPWFSTVQFRPAKGEILTIRIPDLDEPRIIHRGIWLVQISPHVYKAGATYEWKQLDNVPTAEGRRELEERLRELLKVPFEVLDHEASVRPIHLNQRPVLGVHDIDRRIALLNGLGSKGTLQAPLLAYQLARLMLDGMPLDATLDVNQKPKSKSPVSGINMVKGSNVSRETSRRQRPAPLTEQAQQAIRNQIAPQRETPENEILIDATAGNGYDTRFLALLAGTRGRVIAIDIQPEALTRTEAQLQSLLMDTGASPVCASVKLVLDDHANLLQIVAPADHGKVGAVMFNLGYLPSGDKALVTRAVSTQKALQGAIAVIRPGGIITVIAYRGHPGGMEEASTVEAFLSQLPSSDFSITTSESMSESAASKPSPKLFVIRRKGHADE